jgi:predicted RNase H-like nuclease (RuvC/YqgF family)
VPVDEGGDGLKKALEAAQAQVASLRNELEESAARVRELEGEIGRVDSVWMMAVEQLQGQVSSLEMQVRVWRPWVAQEGMKEKKQKKTFINGYFSSFILC